MSLIAELEQLHRKKAELKNKLQSIEETEKILVIRMKVLEEKHIIKVLEKQIKVKLASVEELKSRIRELQNTLEERQNREPKETIVKMAPSNKPVAQTT